MPWTFKNQVPKKAEDLMTTMVFTPKTKAVIDFALAFPNAQECRSLALLLV
jgi:hypothetical protein